MLTNWYLIFAAALAQAFFISLGLTALMRWASHKWDIVDRPGERKIHEKPMPVLGGVAIFLTFNLVIFGNLLLLEPDEATFSVGPGGLPRLELTNCLSS